MSRFCKQLLFCVLTICQIATSITQADEPQGRKVFSEDFEQGTERWELLDPKTWKISEREGNHTLEITARESEYAPPYRSPLHIALIKDLDLADFEIRFRVRSTKDTGNHRDCCIFFNYIDNKHFYYAHLGALPDPASGQVMIVKDAPRLALTENKRPVPWTSQWHEVRLVRLASDGLIEVYFDDMEVPLMKISDKSYGSGRVGIGSFDDMNEFDDIVIYDRSK